MYNVIFEEIPGVSVRRIRVMTMYHFSLLLVLGVLIAALSASLSMTGVTGQKVSTVTGRDQHHNYAEALWKSVMFFEGQRSGKLPTSQRMAWRKDSALEDGHDIGVDLVGGYYDAGDNLKFGFPMAYTTTVLSWSIIEFGVYMGPEIQHALAAVRWATDYLLKATSEPNKIYVGVGDPWADHNCWQRPEDMDTPRTVYAIDAQKPGSEVAAETAAALAAASIALRESDPHYSDTLLNRSFTVFEFADKYRGSYSVSLGRGVCPFYCDWNGYLDELLWGAAWIYKASNSSWYWEYIATNLHWLESASSSVGEFGWDDKHAGIYVLLYKDFIRSKNQTLVGYQKKAEDFACTVLPESPTKTVKYSAGGLLFKKGGSNMQNPAALSFLLVVFAQYLTVNNNHFVGCSNNVTAPPSRLIELAKRQVDYILGDNPMNMSYMVGYGVNYPRRIHHRASSLPSIDVHPKMIPCKDGTPFYRTNASNPNVLVGAIVGGPSEDDYYPDLRTKFVQSEPTTYINGPMVGVFAYFNAHG